MTQQKIIEKTVTLLFLAAMAALAMGIVLGLNHLLGIPTEGYDKFSRQTSSIIGIAAVSTLYYWTRKKVELETVMIMWGLSAFSWYYYG